MLVLLENNLTLRELYAINVLLVIIIQYRLVCAVFVLMVQFLLLLAKLSAQYVLMERS